MTTTPETKPSIDDVLTASFSNSSPVFDQAMYAPVEDEKKEERTAFNSLTPAQQDQAIQLAQQLDVTSAEAVLDYGSKAQQHLGIFSQDLLNKVTIQDTGEVGEILSELMVKLAEADPKQLAAEDKNIFRKLFGKMRRSITDMKIQYQAVGTQIDEIATKLDKEKNVLLKDSTNLETLYQQNKQYFEVLNIYIAAAELKIDEMLTVTIPEAVTVAESSSNQMHVQTVNDLNQFLDRLEKRTHDLKLARQISIQQAPQIRLIQNTNQTLAEKIQSSIHTSIPLWKNQVAIALTLLRQKDASMAQRQVSQTTNDLLTRNAEMLKISSIETAHENERGVIDIETLQKTQSELIETLTETLQIQRDGRIKRKEAERELTLMESRLKQSLLETTQNQH